MGGLSRLPAVTGLPLLFVLAALWACSGGGGTSVSRDALGDVDVGRGPVDVVIAPRDVPVLPDARFDLTDDGGDTAGSDTGPDGGDVWQPQPCQSHADCAGGYCVEAVPGSGEYVCTTGCIEECPLDWVCKSVYLDGPDPVSICLPPGGTLCKVCQDDKDCLLASALCIRGSATLGFCGRGCNPDADDCPDGFECALYSDAGGTAQGYQCQPLPGQCCVTGELTACEDDNPCTFDGCDPALGCTHAPAPGECSGDEPCTDYHCEEGECVGTPIVVDDTLDKVDSDCDGLTDEDAYKGFRLVTGDFHAAGGTAAGADVVLSGALCAPPVGEASAGADVVVQAGLVAFYSLLDLFL